MPLSPTLNRDPEPPAVAPTLDRIARHADRYGLGALSFYLVLSVLFFGRALAGHMSDYHIGVDVPADSTIFIWSLAWWRHAILHQLDPLFTTAIWAPGGINLAWVTTAPLAAILAIPATGLFGPVATCNALFILGPTLSAWTAFVLCRRFSSRYWPALVGGYIFGFSAYMLGQMQGHLHQVLAFPVPLAVYLVMRRYQDDLRTRSFIVALGFTLAAEFLIALEVFATMTVFGLMAIVLALVLNPPAIRKRIARLVPPLSLAYSLAAVMVAPFIYYLLKPAGIPHWGSMYSADPVGFLIPTDYFELGRLTFLKAIANRFPLDQFESDNYFGPVLIVIAALYARRHWREPFARMMTDALIIIAVLSLGATLHVMGRHLAALPGAVLTSLPMLDKATPSRFAMYAFLILGVIGTIWLNELTCRPAGKLACVALIVLSTLPNLSADHWARPNNTPGFFTTGAYRKFLAPGEIVITLP